MNRVAINYTLYSVQMRVNNVFRVAAIGPEGYRNQTEDLDSPEESAAVIEAISALIQALIDAQVEQTAPLTVDVEFAGWPVLSSNGGAGSGGDVTPQTLTSNEAETPQWVGTTGPFPDLVDMRVMLDTEPASPSFNLWKLRVKFGATTGQAEWVQPGGATILPNFDLEWELAGPQADLTPYGTWGRDFGTGYPPTGPLLSDEPLPDNPTFS